MRGAPEQAVVAYGEFGRETEMLVQDSSCLAGEGEGVSFLTLQARAMAVGQVLVGFFDIPRSIEQPLQLVINPEARTGCAPLCCARMYRWDMVALLQCAQTWRAVPGGHLQGGECWLEFWSQQWCQDWSFAKTICKGCVASSVDRTLQHLESLLAVLP